MATTSLAEYDERRKGIEHNSPNAALLQGTRGDFGIYFGTKAGAGRMAIRDVYLVFKTHLDVGFTNYARAVVKQYFEYFVPKALSTAEELRRCESPCGFVWTTGSWLIYEYLEAVSGQARKRMEQAILLGDIAWHALPFTTHTELMDAPLFEFGLGLSQELDRRFGRMTIAAKMTDVPGHTRSMVPLLARAGVKFLHIGVNSASCPPSVPPLFVWRESDACDIIVMYSAKGYGDIGVAPMASAALCFAHTNDNLGPQSPSEVDRAFEKTRERFPRAALHAARLDHFAHKLLAAKSRLPVVTQEIGDTWIHGAGTDPGKVARFRELLRLRTRWLAHGSTPATARRLARFSRKLLLVPEHTWGMDEKTFLHDYSRYTKPALRALRRTRECRRFESSWAEQRRFVNDAVKELGAGTLAREARRALASIGPRKAALNRTKTPVYRGERFECAHFDIAFDPRTGAINRLRQKRTGRVWATAADTLGLFSYETFGARDYERFKHQYLMHRQNWAVKDFSKPGMETSRARRTVSLPRLVGLARRGDASEDRFVLQMAMPHAACAQYGCPRHVSLSVTLPRDRPEIHLRLEWRGKDASRLPEASWFSFSPHACAPDGWAMEKLGREVRPHDVVRNGNRKLHAVGDGVWYRDARGEIVIRSLDAPLVAPGAPSLLDFNNRMPPLQNGMHFNLHNNIWGTNFPMWYEDDAVFRFVLAAR